MLSFERCLRHNLSAVFIVLGTLVLGANTCNPGLDTGGWIYPRDDQYVEVRQPFEMYCVLNESQNLFPNATSKDLRFYVDGKPLLGEEVTVHNETAIKLRVEHSVVAPSFSHYSVSCKLHDKGLCTRYVFVGYQPQPVTNFSCLSRNWENLTCTWDEPQNPIQTLYDLYYTPQSSGRTPNMGCPADGRVNGSCTWTITSTPPYRKGFSQYKFQMKRSNMLTNGTRQTQTFNVNHFARVLPSKMEKLTLMSVTKSSAAVYWRVPEALVDFPPGLVYKVSYQPLPFWAGNREIFVDTQSLNKTAGELYFTLEDLPHAGIRYEVKVRAKSADADDLWSEAASLIIKTNADYPCAPPRTLDSFEIIRSELVVYWDPVAPECENGDEFQYLVTLLSDGTEVKSLTVNRTEYHANLGRYDNRKDFFVKISSVNILGPAALNSTIYVPREDQRLDKPFDVTSVTYSPSEVEVLWKPPRATAKRAWSDITAFTVYWCLGQVTAGLCNGQLRWSKIDAGVYAYNITLSDAEFSQDVVVFVAAHEGNTSSGMERSTCDIQPTVGIDNVTDVNVTNIEISSLTVKWSQIDCKERVGLILEYRVHYCVADHNGDCQGNDTVVSVDSSEKSARLQDLEASTEYSVRVAVVSRLGEGNLSSPIVVRTLSPPLSLEVLLGIIITAVVMALLLIAASVQVYCYMRKRKLARRLKPLLPWESQASGALAKFEDKKNPTKPISSIPATKLNNYDRLTGSVSSSGSAGERTESSAKVVGRKAEEATPPQLTIAKTGSVERHGRSRSGDSSGCSSGHESLSSHETAGSRELYAHDSGTEMESSPTPDHVFAEFSLDNVKAADRLSKGSLPSVHYIKPSLQIEPVSALPAAQSVGDLYPSHNVSEPYVKMGLSPGSVNRDGYVTLGLTETRPGAASPNASPCLSTASNDSVRSDHQLLPVKLSGSRPTIVARSGETRELTDLSLARPDLSDSESDKEDLLTVPEITVPRNVPTSGYVTADIVKQDPPKPVNGYVTLGGIERQAAESHVIPISNSHYVALGLGGSDT